MSISDSYVSITPGTGSNVRTLKMNVLQDDGSVATVYVQATALVDSDGYVLHTPYDRDWQQEVLAELQAIRSGLEAALGTSLR